MGRPGKMQAEMPPRHRLNSLQLATLQWIADGSPTGAMTGYSHRVSAAALRSRDLIRISGRGPSWRARITPSGQAYLDSPDPVKAGDPRAGSTTTRPAAARTGKQEAVENLARSPARRASVGAPGIAVPTTLRGAHRFVTATRDAATGLTAASDGRIHVGPKPGVVHMVLSRPLLRRALLVVQGLLRETAKRDWEMIPHIGSGYGGRAGVAIAIRGHQYPVEVHELTETVPFTAAEIAAWRTEWSWDTERRAGQMPPPQRKRKRPTGRLKLALPTTYGGGRANWAEGPRGPLESKIASVLRTLAERSDADDQATIEQARLADERRLVQNAREVQAREERVEKDRVNRLMAEVASWRGSVEARAYIATLEQTIPSLQSEERARLTRWCTWARDWTDRSDPSRDTSLVVGLDNEHDIHHAQ
jgi:hypothetical protein